MANQPHNRNKHGAALVFVLVVVIVISLLALGIAQLVVTHFSSEEQLRGYAHAYYIAESGVNWQLNRMSRSELSGTPTIPQGRLPAAAVTNYPSGFFAPSVIDSTTALDGQIQVMLFGLTNVTAPWNPPGDFYLTVVGQDPQTGITRGLRFLGGATGLSDRYTLYALNRLAFNSDPTDPNGYCTLGPNFICTDGQLTYNNQGLPPTAGPGFGGCRLGPQASVSAGGWTGAWDLPRIPAPVRWPSIDEVVRFVWGGDTVAQIQSNNDNATQILYRQADGSYVPFTTVPTKLTNAEFSASNYIAPGNIPQRTIKLTVQYPLSGNQHNLFYFTDIQMGSSDMLVLDLHDTTNPSTGINTPTAIRILIYNPRLAPAESSLNITNLVYSGQPPPTANSYLWFNYTNAPFTFTPTPGYGTLHGMVYGISPLAAANNSAGDIIINGSRVVPASVDCLVGNHIQLNGQVSVTSQPVESRGDPNHYVLYYRILEGLQETDGNGNVTNTYRSPVIGYGPFQ